MRVGQSWGSGRERKRKHEKRFEDNTERAPLLTGRVSFAVVALSIFVPSLAPKSSFRERLGLCWELCRTRLIRMREGS